MLPETVDLTILALNLCAYYKVPVKILTKISSWLSEDFIRNHYIYRDIIAFGFTLTGHDELEPGASTNQARINAMQRLHDAGYKTFASIEPIIDFESSLDMILSISAFDGVCSCDLLKIGLESGKKYNKENLLFFVNRVIALSNAKTKIYFKDTLLKLAGINRDHLPANYCVGRNYNLFGKEATE